VFTLGSNVIAGGYSGSNQVAYCWTATAGKSAFGTYTGTNPATQTINLGFEPSWVMIKATTAGTPGNVAGPAWQIVDSARNATVSTPGSYSELLLANSSAAEFEDESITLGSTGFTVVSPTAGSENVVYIYIAFA
jgi:hypothetical protein